MSWEIQPQQIAQRLFIEWMFVTKSVTGLVSWGEAHQVGGAETQEGVAKVSRELLVEVRAQLGGSKEAIEKMAGLCEGFSERHRARRKGKPDRP